MNLIDAIDQQLPQTQCTQCGYNGCRPYAEAIARGTPHNQCPPGGAPVIEKLSALLNREVIPFNPKHGVEKPKVWAYIREADCIGCTKCIDACPTDAILGSGKMMHTVIQSECTGCQLCVEPCPMDCIELVPAPEAYEQRDHYRLAHQRKQKRMMQLDQLATIKHDTLKQPLVADKASSAIDKQAFIAAAVARANTKKKTFVREA
jgi:electron transport complex protein RnfB